MKQTLLMQGPPVQPHRWTPPQQETPVLSPAAAPSPGESQVTKVTFWAITKLYGAFEQKRTQHSLI